MNQPPYSPEEQSLAHRLAWSKITNPSADPLLALREIAEGLGESLPRLDTVNHTITTPLFLAMEPIEGAIRWMPDFGEPMETVLPPQPTEPPQPPKMPPPSEDTPQEEPPPGGLVSDKDWQETLEQLFPEEPL